MGRLIRRFEECEAWEIAIDLAVLIYEISAEQPFARDFSLSGQIHKAANSISSNIAEGFERGTRRELRRFLDIAKGSCGEVRSQLHLAHRLDYISDDMHTTAVAQAEHVSRKLSRFKTSIRVK